MKDLKSIGIEPGRGKLYEEIVYSTGLLYNTLTNDISAFLTPHELSPGKFNIMMIVKHTGKDTGISQVEVSKRLIVTPSNMTKMIDKLEKEGMVGRFALQGDKRVKVLKITPKGSALLDKVWGDYDRRLRRLTANLNEDKQKQLSVLLQEWLQTLRT